MSQNIHTHTKYVTLKYLTKYWNHGKAFSIKYCIIFLRIFEFLSRYMYYWHDKVFAATRGSSLYNRPLCHRTQFDRVFDRIYIFPQNMPLVLSWRRRLRTYESAKPEAGQPTRNRSAKRSGFGLLALAEILVSHGILWYQEILRSDCRDYEDGELEIHTMIVIMTR